MTLTPSQLATTLAALRFWQLELKLGNQLPAEIHDIANDFGTVEPLGLGAIDELCEQLNCDTGPDTDLVSAVRDLKPFGGPGGTDAEDRVREILDTARDTGGANYSDKPFNED